MSDFWDDDRTRPRGSFVIPCLLHDTTTPVYIKAVLLDVSAEGCRVFTNDRRVRMMEPEALIGRTFRIEFDLEDVESDATLGKVVNVHPGKDAFRERQLGIQFTAIDPKVARRLDEIVRSRSRR